VAELQDLKLEKLIPSPYNPRKQFNRTDDDELADSIRAQGLLSPLLVRPVNGDGGQFEIVAGERRYRAAKQVGLAKVPCIVREFTDEAAREAQIIENLQRQDISPLEEASGFQELLKTIGSGAAEKVTVDQIAERVGKSKRYIYARLQLLGLSEPVKKALASGKIEASHAQELAPLKPEQQAEMVKRIDAISSYEGVMPVHELREEIKYRYSPKPAPPKLSAKEKARRAKEAERQKKADAAWKRQQAKSAAERERKLAVMKGAIIQLWPKLKNASAKDREHLLDLELLEFANTVGSVGQALMVADGKPLISDAYIPKKMMWKWKEKFEKRPRSERLPLVLLASVIDRSDYGEKDPLIEELFRWAKIDRKAIDRQLTKEAAQAVPKASAQMSAKPKGKAHARTNKTQKKK
jgi:ParB family chromosome partitioning protein